MATGQGLPRWLWRALLLSLGGVLLLGLAGPLLLAGGLADPPRAGPLRWQVEAAPGDCLAVAALDLPALVPPLTLEAVADQLPDADPFAAWGVWLGAPDDAAFRWEVLPPGYYRHAGQTVAFHHVRGGTNTLRVDVAGGRFTLWLNQERATAGVIDSVMPWGLVDAPGICWQRLSLWASE